MTGPLRALITLLVVAFPLWAAGQGTRPSTEPAVDSRTPKGALRELNVSMREGNVPAIERILLATTPAERKMVTSDAEMAAALADIRRAAIVAYGPAAAKTLTGDTATGDAESLARIDSAQVTIKGDSATVTYSDERESPFVLKRVDGEWKVPVSQLGKPVDRAALEQRLADLATQTRVVREVTKLIRDNKLPTAQQARDAWQSRIMQAATSQPARDADRPRQP